jgi:uncharacterized protein YaiI (UPF0178 family)
LRDRSAAPTLITSIAGLVQRRGGASSSHPPLICPSRNDLQVTMSSAPHVYVDADACPVKAETVKVAERHGLPVVFVANAWLNVPRAPRVRVQVVSGSFDAADDWIVEQARRDDIVVTADIPLAARCLKLGARVLGPAGKPFTEDNIGNALATRELMADLRAYGVGGGAPPFEAKDRSRFLEALERVVREARKGREVERAGAG